MKQKRLPVITAKETESDLSVDLTIHSVPASLLEEFAQRIIILYYPSGVGDGIKDLMRNAVTEELLFVKAKKILRDNNG